MKYEYIYNDNCFYCKIVTPLIDDLIKEGFEFSKHEWVDDRDSKYNKPTPSILCEDTFFDSSVILSSFLVYDMYPDKFSFNSRLDVLKFILKENKPLPLEYLVD
jgi:hypothetical protein